MDELSRMYLAGWTWRAQNIARDRAECKGQGVARILAWAACDPSKAFDGGAFTLGSVDAAAASVGA